MAIERIKAEDYVKPSKYIKFESGANKVQILSDIFVYDKYGTKVGGRYIAQIDNGVDELNPVFKNPEYPVEPKKCWGFVAYSYDLKKFGLIECGVMLGDQLAQLAKSDPENYKRRVITVTKTGEGLKTKYEAKFESAKVIDGTPSWWDDKQYDYYIKQFGIN